MDIFDRACSVLNGRFLSFPEENGTVPSLLLLATFVSGRRGQVYRHLNEKSSPLCIFGLSTSKIQVGEWPMKLTFTSGLSSHKATGGICTLPWMGCYSITGLLPPLRVTFFSGHFKFLPRDPWSTLVETRLSK